MRGKKKVKREREKEREKERERKKEREREKRDSSSLLLWSYGLPDDLRLREAPFITNKRHTRSKLKETCLLIIHWACSVLAGPGVTLSSVVVTRITLVSTHANSFANEKLCYVFHLSFCFYFQTHSQLSTPWCNFHLLSFMKTSRNHLLLHQYILLLHLIGSNFGFIHQWPLCHPLVGWIRAKLILF